MTEEQAEVGGVAWELSEAIRAMGEAMATGDPEQIAIAMRRHAEALSNQSLATVVPTLRSVLESVVKNEIGAITTAVNEQATTQGRRFDYVLSEISAFTRREDASRDAYSADLQKIDEKIGGLGAGQERLQAEFQGGLSSIRGVVSNIAESVDELESRFTGVESTVDRILIDHDAMKHDIVALRTDMTDLQQRVLMIETTLRGLISEGAATAASTAMLQNLAKK